MALQSLTIQAFKLRSWNTIEVIFSSNVTTRVTVTDESLKEQLALDGLPSEFVISAVSHGLVSLNALSTFDNTDILPLSLTTSTELNGNTDFNFELSQFNHQGSDENGTGIYHEIEPLWPCHRIGAGRLRAFYPIGSN